MNQKMQPSNVFEYLQHLVIIPGQPKKLSIGQQNERRKQKGSKKRVPEFGDRVLLGERRENLQISVGGRCCQGSMDKD